MSVLLLVSWLVTGLIVAFIAALAVEHLHRTGKTRTGHPLKLRHWWTAGAIVVAWPVLAVAFWVLPLNRVLRYLAACRECSERKQAIDTLWSDIQHQLELRAGVLHPDEIVRCVFWSAVDCALANGWNRKRLVELLDKCLAATNENDTPPKDGPP